VEGNGPENISIILIHYEAGLGVGVGVFLSKNRGRSCVNTHFIGPTAHKHDAVRALRTWSTCPKGRRKINTFIYGHICH